MDNTAVKWTCITDTKKPCNTHPLNVTSLRPSELLQNALLAGHVQCAESLLQRGSIDIGSDGVTVALNTAAKYGYETIVELLIEAGANVNMPDDAQETALVFAAAYGYDKCVDLLLKAGADVNLQNSRLSNALLKAAANGHAKCVGLLLKAGSDSVEKAMRFSSREGHSECVKLFLSSGADVNQEQYRTTYLLEAIRSGSLACVQLLLEAGADVNVIVNYRNTALLAAAAIDHTKYRHQDEIIKLLLKSGAPVNHLSWKNQNALETYIAERNPIFPDKTTALLLLAAGETIRDTTVTRFGSYFNRTLQIINAPAFLLDLKPSKSIICLKELCRSSIRKHLLDTDLHRNLFHRIPDLGLPTPLTRYLLYHMSLEDAESSSSDEDA